MPLYVRAHDRPRAFLDRASAWMLQSEAEHALILGLAGRLANSAGSTEAVFATIEQGDAVVGVAMRTPPHKLLLSRMPLGAAPLVADWAAERFDHLPAVLGPADVADAVGREWTRRRPVTAHRGMRQRIFELTTLVPPSRPADGAARLAGPDDLTLVADWARAFGEEVGASMGSGWAERSVADGRVLLWDNGGTVAMAAETARSPTGARVGAVYTPPRARGRGYATAVVADLSRRLLAGGARFCSLYTDLANPTSNAIYQRLGYAAVADVEDVEFRSAT